MAKVRTLVHHMVNFLADIDRQGKIAIQVAADCTIIFFCFLFAMAIRLEDLAFIYNSLVWLVLSLSTAAAVVTFSICGLYRTLVRSLTGKIMGAIVRGVTVLSLSLLVLNVLLDADIPRSATVMTAAFALLAVGGLRFLIKDLLRGQLHLSRQSVVIYGAGEAGIELLNSLRHGKDYVPVAFIDDDPKLHGLLIAGCRVYSLSDLAKLVDSIELDAVLLALPSIGPVRRREILSELNHFELKVKTIPSLSDVISGKAKISQLRQVSPEELLGRDPVPPDEQLIRESIAGKVVMVTGAGGSIGSELCRQIFNQKPLAIVLYEVSEIGLYSIASELFDWNGRTGEPVKLLPILGSVQDEARLDAVIRGFKVETVYHAAAYKHVPIVEENVIEGIRNNVFGTLATAKIASKNGVERFILISTDKAVRPTNIMGAAKRIAELICQGFGQLETRTVFSMVRFGNVLGSSGSVMPLFSRQIQMGGPITVTHPDINRYFMTIPEASQLVIQAGAMAKGGDVFVLDMGAPVKIVDLAVAMVKLHGLKPYFPNNLTGEISEIGDIAIRFTGLRKGEKLFEELLIGKDPKPTRHSRIMTASEDFVPFDCLMDSLQRLREACDVFDLLAVKAILEDLPLEYSPTTNEINDLTWVAMKESGTFHARDI